jgi:hypothetical protein
LRPENFLPVAVAIAVFSSQSSGLLDKSLEGDATSG